MGGDESCWLYQREQTKMARVITYGTYDLFHAGHLRLLQRAKALVGEGGWLIVEDGIGRFN